jgi:predicted alpha-1,2-mannosidase
MIGTSRMGHVFPGATAPFGMVQLSPQTNFEIMYGYDGKYNKHTYEYCAGYQYKDTTILGFTHTNFSGTGHSDLGDFLVMPTIESNINEKLTSKEGAKSLASGFSHKNETASAGYYKVKLSKHNITAELTASERVGFHQYTFPSSKDSKIVLDMVYNIYHHPNKNVWSFVRVENDSTVVGYRQTKGWARTRKQFFAMKFSKPFKSYGHQKLEKVTYNGFYRRFKETKNFPEFAGKELKAYFSFDTKKNEKIKIKFALSSVSTEGAMKNLNSEVPHWDFDKTKKSTQQKWNNELAVVDAEFSNKDEKVSFYTSLYHTMLSPIMYEDVDGKYRGLDQNIHESKGFTNYTIFSLWDTYRALHPLFNIIQPVRNNDMIKSMLAHYDQSVHNMLPIWSHYANENWCMIGYHATSVIADAMVKGVGDFDKNKALEACLKTSNVDYYEGIGEYKKYGYVPEDLSHSSVSKTLEYAYNDWCISQIAKLQNKNSIVKTYLERSENYKHHFDKSIGFMRPKLSNGKFKADFDPLDTHGQGFIEGNAWNYGLYVPHQVKNMINMLGADNEFVTKLDSIFTMHLADKYIEHNEDITRDGLIGNYVHGNEPSHHIPYLYNWTNKAYKTQEKVRMIMNKMYLPKVDGLCGNDDAGQMSAWYILSSFGFYPVCPGDENYAIGSPLIKSAKIKLSNGKFLTINCKNQSKENLYVKSVKVNGKLINSNFFKHSDIANGGTIEFEMSSKHK